MRRLRVLFSLLLAATAARAEDSAFGVTGGTINETSHRMTVVLGRGHARIVAERTLANDGESVDAGGLSFQWPTDGAMTGLAIRDGDRWLPATLLDAEPATALFTKLTGKGLGPAQPTALLEHPGTLSVFPIRTKERRTARIEGVLPGTYAEGRYTFQLPKMGTEKLPAQVTLMTEARGDLLFHDKKQVPVGATFALEADTELAVRPVRGPVVTMHVASPGTGKRAVFHLGVELAPHVSEAPKGALVVIVVDASRSRSAEALELERAAAATYLSRMNDARAQVITFDRRVEVRLPRFTPSREAQQALWKMPLVRRNGSDLDLALARAIDLFDAEGGAQPRRLLVLGDLLTRANLDVSPAMRALADRGVVAHAVQVGELGGGLTRDDDHVLAGALRATGGLVWDLGGKDATQGAIIEELVRPIRFDKLAWEIPHVQLDALGLPTTLAEGEGHAITILTSTAVPGVNLRGEAWASKVAFGAAPTDAENVRWSALAFGTDLASQLSRDEKRTLAHRGHAVTEETSLIVVAPESRGSTDGLSDERGLSLSGSSGGSGTGGIGVGHAGRGHRGGFDGAARLAEMMSGAYRACGGKGQSTLVVETTRDEVVLARAASLPERAPATLSSCLVESAFSLDLPREFSRAHAEWQVKLGE